MIEHEGEIHNNLIINGKIASFQATELLLRNEIKKILKPILGFIYPTFTALVSIPSDSDEVAIRTYRDSLEHAGAKKCFMLYDCYIAAAGLEVDIKNSIAMIVDFGASKTSITTIREYEIIKNDILDIAGNNLNEAIQAYISRQYNLSIDLIDAEKLKIEYLDLESCSKNDKKIKISGKDKQSNTLKEISFQSKEISDCLNNEINFLIDRITRHLENLDYSDSQKIKSNGVYLIGGGIKLKGLIELIAKKMNVSKKSFNFTSDFMKIGFERIQSNPKELYMYMLR